GLVSASLLRWMLGGERRIVTVSRVHHGVPGLREVALSLPTVVGQHGAGEVVMPGMDPAETQALQRSAQVIQRALAELEIPQ
ncbi:MAG TPA: L-lactate dehydrogenase, partial [Burkholderiales bacterium]